ncbi:MAG TPA: hemolysin family protein [Armatimonadota bacterium]|nr:hemolysin family protein [Armatimonadota bacterium]
MEDALSTGLLIGIGVLILFVFFLSLSEASLVAVSRVRLRRRADEGDRAAANVLRLLESPEFISAIIVAINILVISISALATLYVHRLEELEVDIGIGEQAVHLLILCAILVFAEITPKNIGASYPTAISRFVVRPVRVLTFALSPLVTAATAAGNLVMRGTGAHDAHHGHFVTQDDLRAAVDMGEEEDVLEPSEGEMFDSALGLSATVARRIMVPRVDLVALERGASIDEALQAIQDSGFSRIPVYDDDIDSVVGVVHANDLLRSLRSGMGEKSVVGDFLKEPKLIPETKPVDELFREMRESKNHIAIVIDEQGGTEGIVTIEDILEELVGEIEDEHDTPGEEIRMTGENEAVVAPKARIEDVNDRLGTSIPGDEHETISGYVAGEIGRLPDVGETYRLDAIEVTVQGEQEEPELLVRVLIDDRKGGESSSGS